MQFRLAARLLSDTSGHRGREFFIFPLRRNSKRRERGGQRPRATRKLYHRRRCHPSVEGSFVSSFSTLFSNCYLLSSNDREILSRSMITGIKGILSFSSPNSSPLYEQKSIESPNKQPISSPTFRDLVLPRVATKFPLEAKFSILIQGGGAAFSKPNPRSRLFEITLPGK